MLFRGKKVVVVGGGNSAATEALHLHNLGVQVTMVHRRDAFRAQDYLVKSVLANDIPVLWNTEVKEIKGQERVSEVLLVNNQTGETTTFPTDGVFIAVGYTPTVELAMKTGIELTPEGFHQARRPPPDQYSRHLFRPETWKAATSRSSPPWPGQRGRHVGL